MSTVNQSTGPLVRTLGFRSKMDSAEGLVDNLDLGLISTKKMDAQDASDASGALGCLGCVFCLAFRPFFAIFPTPGRRNLHLKGT